MTFGQRLFGLWLALILIVATAALYLSAPELGILGAFFSIVSGTVVATSAMFVIVRVGRKENATSYGTWRRIKHRLYGLIVLSLVGVVVIGPIGYFFGPLALFISIATSTALLASSRYYAQAKIYEVRFERPRGLILGPRGVGRTYPMGYARMASLSGQQIKLVDEGPLF